MWLVWLLVSRPSICVCWTKPLGPLPPRRRMVCVVLLPVCVQQVHVVASIGGVERHQLIVVPGVIAYSGRVTESVILTRFPQVWISMSAISQVSLP